jgi:hypothetical protein
MLILEYSVECDIRDERRNDNTAVVLFGAMTLEDDLLARGGTTAAIVRGRAVRDTKKNEALD